jgi:hypothetical protein
MTNGKRRRDVLQALFEALDGIAIWNSKKSWSPKILARLSALSTIASGHGSP